MLYRDFVRTLAERVSISLESIEVGHNFEYGVEFEIVLCEALRSALPDRYGIARGYAVDQQGNSAGDDILIFARERFPTLALRNHDDFARKEFVPIEATYCYIEAKHTVFIDTRSRQSLRHACEQVSRVKSLCSSRSGVSSSQIGPYDTVGGGLAAHAPPDFPQTRNPSFGVVFARHVGRNPKSPPCTTGSEVEALLAGFEFPKSNPPDMVVLGNNLVVVPALSGTGGSKLYRSPFFIDGRSCHEKVVVDSIAFGIGFASILAALDWIQLDKLPWHQIIVDALGIPP